MRVMLTGTYSSANKGDAAMELATIAALREAAPEVDVVVASPFPELDRATYAPASVVKCNRRNGLGFLQVVAALLARLLGRPDWLLRGDELSALATTDVVVDLSGDMLTEDYGVLVAVSHYLPLLQARLLGIPYILCAQSIGPFRWTRPLAHWLIRGAAAVTVRETISESRFRPLRADLERTGDMAFLLEPDPDRLPPGVEQSAAKRPLLGVSLSSLVASKHELDGPGSFEDEVADGLRRFLDAHQHDAVFVAHVTGPTAAKDDRVIARRVAARLGARARVVEDDLHPAAVKALIASFDVFLGARMHANIAALTSGVPVVAISYSHKTRGIMAEFAQEDLVIPAQRLHRGQLATMLERAVDERDERREVLARRSAALVEAARRNVTIIVDLLNGEPRD